MQNTISFPSEDRHKIP